MSEVEVLNELLRSDKELETTYWYYQKLKLSFNHKNSRSLIDNLKNYPPELSKSMKTSIHSLLKFETELENSLSYRRTNNLIKVIKKIAFSYLSYENFRSLILLITNTMVRLEYK